MPKTFISLFACVFICTFDPWMFSAYWSYPSKCAPFISFSEVRAPSILQKLFIKASGVSMTFMRTKKKKNL